MRFEAGKIHERAAELARLKPQPLQITRTWKDEHVYIGAHDATFIGLAAEHEIYVPNPAARAGKIKAALRSGGLFVLEFFLDQGDGGVKPAELRAQFADGFDILRDEVVEDHPDWGQDRAKLVRFVARKR